MKTENNEKNGVTEYEFCKVCKINHNRPSKHKYFPSHKLNLSNFLSKFHSKISQFRSSILNPNSHHNRFWCVFCDCHVTDQDASFPRSDAIQHLASTDHLKNVKHFIWKHGSGQFQIDDFRVTDTDLAKWEKKSKLLNSEGVSSSIGPCLPAEFGALNDIHNKINNENICSFENDDNSYSIHSLSNNVIPLQYSTDEYQVSSYSQFGDVANNGSSLHRVTSSCPGSSNNGTVMCSNPNLPHCNHNGCSVTDYPSKQGMHQGYMDQSVVNGGRSQGYQNLTRISFKASEDGGNVHSGAPPPWLEIDEFNQYNVQSKPDLFSLGSASSRSGKSRKLNPKRVGAAWAERRKIELEKEKRGEINKNEYDASWLPNFGRVWQSGSRKESRKEFEKEKDKIFETESQSEAPIPVQPYISKRMRRERFK